MASVLTSISSPPNDTQQHTHARKLSTRNNTFRTLAAHKENKERKEGGGREWKEWREDRSALGGSVKHGLGLVPRRGSHRPASLQTVSRAHATADASSDRLHEMNVVPAIIE